MNKETMRKLYETTPKDILINILISSREEVKKLQSRNKERKQEIERLNNIINELEKYIKYINENYIYDEVGMKIFVVSTLQDKLQELKGSNNN